MDNFKAVNICKVPRDEDPPGPTPEEIEACKKVLRVLFCAHVCDTGDCTKNSDDIDDDDDDDDKEEEKYHDDNKKKYLITHTGEKIYKCTVKNCEKAYAGLSGLRYHEFYKHQHPEPSALHGMPNVDVDEDSDLSPGPMDVEHKKKIHKIKCEICDIEFQNQSQLRMHVLKHTETKPHACSKCRYKCYSSSDLNKHLITHTGEKIYKCIVKNCEKAYASRSGLRYHESHKHQHPEPSALHSMPNVDVDEDSDLSPGPMDVKLIS